MFDSFELNFLLRKVNQEIVECEESLLKRYSTFMNERHVALSALRVKLEKLNK